MNIRTYIFFFFLIISICFSCKNPSSDSGKKVELTDPSTIDFVFDHEIRMPLTKSNKKAPLLILLHGLGSNEKDLFTFADNLDSRLVVASPRGPLTVGPIDYSWYTLTREQGKFQYIESEIEDSKIKLLKYIDQLISAYNINPDAVYIGGFSQGAIMSLYTGLTAPDKIAGVVSLSGQMYPGFKNKIKFGSDYEALEILFTHGVNDDVLPFDDIKISALYLLQSGAKVETKWFPTGHKMTQENLEYFIYWISTKVDKHYS